MVVAEVPLWVRHKATSSDADATSSRLASSSSSLGAAAASAAAAAASGSASDAAQARRAADLWNPSSSGRCPVYSIDCHSSYFCTAGGDGTVKVWQLEGLFPGLWSTIREDERGRGGETQQQEGDNEEEDDNEEDEEADEDGRKPRSPRRHDRHQQQPPHPHVGHVDEHGGYVSSEDVRRHGHGASQHNGGKSVKGGLVVSEEDEDNDKSSRSSSSEDASASSSSLSNSHAARSVHDLTGAVRKKKAPGPEGGGVASPPRGNAAATGATASSTAASASTGPASSESPGRHHHPHHRHHGQQHRRRLVTTLSGHSGSSVLAVRFSHHGRYVATGGDDGLVLIYRTTIEPRNVAGAAAAKAAPKPTADSHDMPHAAALDGSSSVIYWPRIHMGTGGHDLDVVDLCWSPDDSLLVSCSVDSRRPILVWKVPAMDDPHSSLHLAPYKVLSPLPHTSTVRGVTFDPAGSYLATSGDDPAICVWRAHDDWGLERRITDIFYRTPSDSTSASQPGPGSQPPPPPPPPPTYHHDPTFVRRLSWSTDGLYIACTNALVKNRHVASTVIRQGWATAGNNNNNSSPSRGNTGTSSSSGSGPGGATLVGHKQPVVASRHCPRLLKYDTGDGEENGDDDDEAQLPKYSTLLALGDKAGFVTVWTTRQSRPVFKLQCASRTTVTDLAWSTHMDDGRIVLLVSQLDGAITALLFGSHELPKLLPPRLEARFFALKYGLEAGSTAGWVGAGSLTQQSQFIESALTLMHQEDEEEDDDGAPTGDDDDDMDLDDASNPPAPPEPSPAEQEVTTTLGGKKRVRPVLIAVGGATAASANASKAEEQRLAAAEAAKKKKNRTADPVQDALEAADKASAAASAAAPNVPEVANDGASPSRSPVRRQPPIVPVHQLESVVAPPPTALGATAPAALRVAIPHSTARLLTVDLPLPPAVDLLDDTQLPTSMIAECSNAIKVPTGSTGEALPYTDILIRKGGLVLWRDQLLGTHACEIAASLSFFAVGTADGTLYLYGNSPSVGWASGQAFRSHPPLVVGSPIVRLRLQEKPIPGSSDRMVELLVVASDGSLAVYELFPNLRVQFKASLIPAMNHMALSSQGQTKHLPDLSRIQFTKRSGRLLLMLGYNLEKNTNSTARAAQGLSTRDAGATAVPKGVGGSIQGFVYDRSLELWMRVSDSRFVLSDFYSGLPSKSKGELSRIDDLVRIGSVTSSIRPGHQGRGNGLSGSALFRPDEGDPARFLTTRSHCEDRMSCALVLKSPEEFKHWLGLYARTLALAGSSDSVRLLTDMILRGKGSTAASDCAWWLSAAPTVLGLERKSLVKSIVLPELRKNLALQRVANEISLLV